MLTEEQEIRSWLARLEADETNRNNPLLAQFGKLADMHVKLLRKMNKIARISDRMQDQLRELNETFRIASVTDPLTGLPNRRLMMERLKAEGARVDRQGGSFGLLMVDIDRFKLINDRFGHDVGDRVIAGTGAILRNNLRDYDTCARWGGEEFVIILPDVTREAATLSAEKLRNKVASQPVRAGEESEATITVSIGVTVFDGTKTLETALREADEALYAAKRGGRNEVAIFEGSDNIQVAQK
jgi:diguanylate cyclase (GGDEF)-like protein